MMSFTTPVALVLLLAIPLVLYIGWPRYGYRRRRDATSLVLRLVIVLLLVLALAGAQSVRAAERLAVVYLVDASDSVGPETQEAELEFVRESLDSMGPDDQVGIVVFGANALIEQSLSNLRELEPVRSTPITTNTDIEEAIRFGLGMFPADAAQRMVILSDGVPTVGDAQAAAQLAAARGVEISYVIFTREATPEVQVTDVSVPSVVTEGQQVNLTLTIESDSKTRAVVTVLASGQVVNREEVDLQQGTNSFSLPMESGQAGFHDYVVQVEPISNDGFYQNNQLATFSRVVGPPRVLLIRMADEEITHLLPALQEAGLEADVVAPDELPIGVVPLAQYSAVILANVPATELSPLRMQAFETYVQDLGGGLVVIGGPNTYGPGGYFQTPLEETLPVEMRLRDQQRLPQLTIVYVIDTSGSMGDMSSGVPAIELAKESIIRSINFLQPTDRAGVIGFETAGQWVADIQPVLDRAALQNQVGTLRAGGGTDIMAGMRVAADALLNDPSDRKHIILLTDGGADPTGLVKLVENLYNSSANVTTSVIAINAGSVQFLADMASAGHGHYHNVMRPEHIPTIFSVETVLATRSYIFEDPFFPALTAFSPIMEGITSTPSLLGYVATTPRQTAQVILAGPEPYRDPILAAWQYGLGRSVAFTSDATARWGAQWVTWGEYTRFWSQAIRWTITEGASTNLETRVVMEGEQARLVVDARDSAGEFLNGLALQMSVVDPSLEGEVLPLRQVAPGRYEAVFTPGAEGAYLVRVNGTQATEDGGQENLSQTTGWVMSYSPEYNVQAPNVGGNILTDLALLTGGRSLREDAGAVFAHNLDAKNATTPLWPWLTLAALLLLPVDIAVRRLVVTRRDVQRARTALFGRAVVMAEAPSARLASLMSAKERAQRRTQQEGEAVDVRPGSTVSALRSRRDQRREERDAVQTPEAVSTAAPSDRPRYQPRSKPQQTDGEENLAGRLLKRKGDRQQEKQ